MTVSPGGQRPDDGVMALLADGERGRRGHMLCLLALVVVLAMLAVNISRHEFWRDELQAWDLARQSNSLTDLHDRARYEGHPLLWHTILYYASRLSARPQTMRPITFVLAGLTAGLVLLASPFRPSVRVALAFGYYLLYEYGTVSRSYGLEGPMLFGFLALRPWRGVRFWAAVLLLVLLCQTSFYGMLLGIACVAAMFLDRKRSLDTSQWKPMAARFWLAGAIVAGASVISCLQMAPPSDVRVPGVSGSLARRLSLAWLPMFESVFVFPRGQLRESFHDMIGAWRGLSVPLGVVTVGLMILVLWRWRASLTLLLIVVTGMYALQTFWFNGALQHYGNLTLAFVAALWLALEQRKAGLLPQPPRPAKGWGLRGPLKVFVAAVLVTQALGGVLASVTDWFCPFSSSSQAAEMVGRLVPPGKPIFGYPDAQASAVAILLNRPMHMIQAHRMGTYMIWNYDQNPLSLKQIMQALPRDRQAYLLVNGDLPQTADSSLKLLGRTEGQAVMLDENYDLYLYTPRRLGVTSR